MTVKEALADLKSIHYNKHGLFTNDEPAWQIAFDALEKQIPKKPNFDGDRYDGNGKLNFYSTWLCPNCKERYEMFYAIYNFCHWCGQAIDWSEENEP